MSHFQVSKREKRQVGLADIKAAEKSGVNVLDRAYQYGNDLNSESALSVYRTLMGELLYDDDESFGGGNDGQNGRENSNSYDTSNQGNSNAQSGQSSYARVSLMELFLCFLKITYIGAIHKRRRPFLIL